MVCWVIGWLRILASQLGRHGRGKGFNHCLDKAGRGWPSTSNQPTNRLTGSEPVIRYTQHALQAQQWAASLVILQQWSKWPYCKEPTNKMSLYTCKGWDWMKVCEVSKMYRQHEVSTRKTGGSGYGASLSKLQNKQNSNLNMHVPCMFKVLSTSWFNAMQLHIHSSYTCTVKLR
jgi:hypothetical protein